MRDPVLEEILRAIEAEARRESFPLDTEAYERWGKDPFVPVAWAGNPAAPICSFGRDPGRDEVRWGQPQVGAAGRLVRAGLLAAAGIPSSADDPRLERALDLVYLTNTVPYKPAGNKAYPDVVKERFRPHLERLLQEHWQGEVVLTLGTEAFRWFEGYAAPGRGRELWGREDRYENGELECVLPLKEGAGLGRSIVVCPLPHPSPLNVRWFGRFPELLAGRLQRRRPG